MAKLRMRRTVNYNSNGNSNKEKEVKGEKGKKNKKVGSIGMQLAMPDPKPCQCNNHAVAGDEHAIPQPTPNNSLAMLGLRYLSFAAILIAWLCLTSLEAKIRAVMVALTFSAIEFHFRAITRPSAAELCPNKPTASTDVIHKGMTPEERDMRKAMGLPDVEPPAPARRLPAFVSTVRARLAPSHLRANGHTTWEQFWANVFYGPVMNDFYRHHLFSLVLPSFLYWSPIAQGLLRAMLYLLNIWVAEVVMGYYLSRVWCRRAWYYRGRWARLDGNITLAYGPLWNLLGALYEVGYPLVYSPVPAFLASLIIL